MSAFHTTHTALMEVQSDNKASFLVAHPALWTESLTIVNPAFGKLSPGTLVTANFRITGERRYFMGLSQFGGTQEQFKADNADKLTRESKIWELRNPKKAAEYRDRGYTNAVGITSPVVKIEAKSAPSKEDVINLEGGRWVEGIYMRNTDYAMFDSMLQLTEVDTANVLLIGPSGCGKTSIPEAIAKQRGMKFLRMNCAVVRDPEEWFGYREAVDGSTVFQSTEFTTTVEEGNAIVVLDEFNRVEPWMHNTLLPLLDHGRATKVHGHEIKRGPNVLFVATVNRGSRFTGTFMLDAAVVNRFSATMYADYLEQPVEIKLLVARTSIDVRIADKIVRAITVLRKFAAENELDVDVSTRSSLKVASLASAKRLPLDLIFQFVVLNLIDDKQLLKNAIDALKPHLS